MKLAEALVHRSDLQKRLEQLLVRASQSARFQEDTPPQEDAAELLDEALAVSDELVDLVRRINVTNLATTLDGGETLTAALARRDGLGRRRRALQRIADAAVGDRHQRYARSELRTVTTVDVADVRGRADAAAKAFRELDIQVGSDQSTGRSTRQADAAVAVVTSQSNRPRSRS